MAGEVPGYTAWLRAQRCVLGERMECAGPMVAHHHTHRRPFSRRAHDKDAMPFCDKHHVQFHNAAGFFKEMRHAERTAFQDTHCDRHWALYSRPIDPEIF